MAFSCLQHSIAAEQSHHIVVSQGHGSCSGHVLVASLHLDEAVLRILHYAGSKPVCCLADAAPRRTGTLQGGVLGQRGLDRGGQQ